MKVKQGSLANNVVWSLSSLVHGHRILVMGYVSLYQVMSVKFHEKNSEKSVPREKNVNLRLLK